MYRVLASLLSALFGLIGVGAVSASAEVPPCEGSIHQRAVFTDQGVLESVAVGGGGVAYVSGADPGSSSAWVKAYTLGAEPRLVVTGEAGPGGLSWNGRQLLWGNGNTQANGQQGDTDPQATLLGVRTGSGAVDVITDRLGMANGVIRANDGAIYATNDFGTKVDRISPKGVVENGWATVESGNGVALSRDGRYLYVNQTFVRPSTIARVEIARPSNVTTYFSAEGLVASNVIFDGLTSDDKGSLYVAALAVGQVWKIDQKRRACVLASGITNPSALAFGSSKKKTFGKRDLMVVGFGGELVRVRGAIGAKYPG